MSIPASSRTAWPYSLRRIPRRTCSAVILLSRNLIVSRSACSRAFSPTGRREAGRTRGYASRTLHRPAAGSRLTRSRRTQEHRRIDGLLARVPPPVLRRARLAPRPRSRHRTRESRATGPSRDRIVPQRPGLLHGGLHARPCAPGKTIEDHRPAPPSPEPFPVNFARSRFACFLWTACLLTPRTSAIRAHDHPATYAFSTWAASTISRRRRRATTASKPSLGSSGSCICVATYLDICQL
jgi:hypothetical protein